MQPLRALRPFATAGVAVFALAAAAAWPHEAASRPAPVAAPPSPQYIVRLHAIRTRDGNGANETVVSPQQFKRWVDKANAVLAASNAGITLQFDPAPGGGDWETLDNTAINHFGGGDNAGWQAANAEAAKHPGRAVVFLRYGAGYGGSVNRGNGWSQGPATGTRFIALPAFDMTTVKGDTTPGTADGEYSVQNIWQLAHDFGHFLGLGHTFPDVADGTTGTEAKAVQYIRDHGGTASALDGDGIADTGPEAGTSFFDSKGWARCSGHDTYTLAGTKANGQPFSYTYSPQRRNIMSYFACEPMTFTTGQVAAMRAALQQPGRKELVDPCPPDFAAVPQASFQGCFDHWTSLGRWPVTLTASQGGGGTLLAGSFQPGASRPVRTLMTSAQFQQYFNTYRAQGWRPDVVSVLSTPAGPRWTVVWKRIEGEFLSLGELTEQQFAAKFTEMRAAGFINTEVAGYTTNGQVRYAGVWVKRPFTDYATYANMTAADYQQRFNQLWAQGFRPMRFAAYPTPAGTRYAATWEKVSGSWVQRMGLTPAAFQQEYNARAAQGYRLHQVNAIGEQYEAIWTRP